MKRKVGVLVLAIALVAAVLAQPEVLYVLLTSWREVTMLASARSVSRMLADPSVPADIKDKLAFVGRVKAFGVETLGEAHSDSYQTWYDTGGQPLGWSVQAAWPDRLEAWTWHYPIAGTVPYKGFPRRDQAIAEARKLQAMGLETTVWPIPAYSTLGWLPDPITSNLVAEEPAELGATILHELLHGTIYFPGNTSLNETMAQFVGEQGIVDFFNSTHDPRAQRAAGLWHDETVFTGFINDLVSQLQGLYARHLPWPPTLRARLALLRDAQQRFGSLPMQTDAYRNFDCRHWNNAMILGYVDYHDHLEWFQEAARRMGTTPRFIAFLKRVSPAQGGMPAALDQLRQEGPDEFLTRHAEQPAPVARRTVEARWPWALGLLVLLGLRARLRRRQDARWPWWIVGLCGVAGIFSGTSVTPWFLGSALVSLGVQGYTKRGLPALDLLLLSGLSGWPWALVPALLTLPWWARRIM
ncbi:MAG TPA: aminopeptidase [Candidatus Xenobia bacterium]